MYYSKTLQEERSFKYSHLSLDLVKGIHDPWTTTVVLFGHSGLKSVVNEILIRGDNQMDENGQADLSTQDECEDNVAGLDWTSGVGTGGWTSQDAPDDDADANGKQTEELEDEIDWTPQFQDDGPNSGSSLKTSQEIPM